MEINLLIHLKTADDIVFDRVHPIGIKRDATRIGAHDPQYSGEIEQPVIGPRVIGITQQIIHAVRVNLARDHLNHLWIWICVIDDTRDFGRKIRFNPSQNL